MIKQICFVAVCGLFSLPSLAESQPSELKYSSYMGVGPEYAWLGVGMEIVHGKSSVLFSVGQVDDVDDNGEE